MNQSTQCSESNIQNVSEVFRLLSDPMRLKILNHLRESELTVNALVECTKSSQPNISKHLSILRSAGIVHRRKEGTSAHFSIKADYIFDLCDRVKTEVAPIATQQESSGAIGASSLTDAN